MNTHKNHVLEIDFLPDEYWYGGIVDQGLRMPLHKDSYLVLDMKRIEKEKHNYD